jgi:hypothetical protein
MFFRGDDLATRNESVITPLNRMQILTKRRAQKEGATGTEKPTAWYVLEKEKRESGWRARRADHREVSVMPSKRSSVRAADGPMRRDALPPGFTGGKFGAYPESALRHPPFGDKVCNTLRKSAVIAENSTP